MSKDSGWVQQLEQRCIEPGRWMIEGYSVSAQYEGRSRKILCWNIIDGPGAETDYDRTQLPGNFMYLDDVREWIRSRIF